MNPYVSTPLHALCLGVALLGQDPAVAPIQDRDGADRDHKMVWLETILETPVILRPTDEARREAAQDGDDADHPEGSVVDILCSNDGKLRWAVVSVGGFIGLGEKHVLVPFADLHWAKVGESFALGLPRTEKELNALPSYDLDKATESGLSASLLERCNTDERLKSVMDDDLKKQMTVAAGMEKGKARDSDEVRAAEASSSKLGWKNRSPALVRASKLEGLAVHDRSMHPCGSVSNLVVKPGSGEIAFAVISLDEIDRDGAPDSVCVPISVLHPRYNEDGDLILSIDSTKQALSIAPPYVEAEEGQPLISEQVAKQSKEYFKDKSKK